MFLQKNIDLDILNRKNPKIENKLIFRKNKTIEVYDKKSSF
jgi:hypothetical protein